jgi:hypothetical protein
MEAAKISGFYSDFQKRHFLDIFLKMSFYRGRDNSPYYGSYKGKNREKNGKK